MAMYTIYAETTDGWVYGQDAVYATARATAIGHASATTSTTIGQYIPAGYRCARGVLEFITSVIPTDRIILSATLSLKAATDSSTTDFDISIVQADWTSPLAAGSRDASYDAVLNAAQDVVWRNTAGLVVGTYYASPALDITRISRTGTTQYGLISSRDVAANQPAGNELITIYSADHGTITNRPYLTVITKDPAHAFATRIADGVRVEFQADGNGDCDVCLADGLAGRFARYEVEVSGATAFDVDVFDSVGHDELRGELTGLAAGSPIGGDLTQAVGAGGNLADVPLAIGIEPGRGRFVFTGGANAHGWLELLEQ